MFKKARRYLEFTKEGDSIKVTHMCYSEFWEDMLDDLCSVKYDKENDKVILLEVYKDEDTHNINDINIEKLLKLDYFKDAIKNSVDKIIYKPSLEK